MQDSAQLGQTALTVGQQLRGVELRSHPRETLSICIATVFASPLCEHNACLCGDAYQGQAHFSIHQSSSSPASPPSIHDRFTVCSSRGYSTLPTSSEL